MYTENQGYYITVNGNKCIIPPARKDVIYPILNLNNKNIKELVLPFSCKVIYCEKNNIKQLVLPEGCESVSCHNNCIKELIIPDSCRWVYCDYDTNIINKENCEKIYYFI